MTTHDPRRRLGRVGEEMATRTLQEAGLTILERNWRCRAGEVDIIAQERAPDLVHGGEIHEWLVFVEVRTRGGGLFGTPEESLTPQKLERLVAAAQSYLQARAPEDVLLVPREEVVALLRRTLGQGLAGVFLVEELVGQGVAVQQSFLGDPEP